MSDRRDLSITCDSKDLTPPSRHVLWTIALRVIASQSDVQISVAVADDTRRPIVIILGVTPAGRNDRSFVGTTVAVGIPQSKQFRLVRDNQILSVGNQTVG